MSKPTSSFGIQLKGEYNLFKTEDGFIKVVDKNTVQAAGTLVPENYGALYHMMMPLALHYQIKFGFDDPTPDDVSEVYKRVVNKLGSILRDTVSEAVQDVLGVPGYAPEDAWDYAKVVPRMGHGVITGVSEYPDGEQEDETNEDSEDDIEDEEEDC